MLESRWVRRIGPGLAAIGAIAVIATSTLGARDRAWDPPPCGGAAVDSAAAGTWWRLDPRLADGQLVGQRLTLGGPGVDRTLHLDIPAEAFAAGPFDGQVLVGSDDGRVSTLALIDPARGCRRPVATSSDVIRRATITADRTAIVEFRVDRTTRTDLGVFRRPLDGGAEPSRLLEPIRPDARFGPTWTTELAWSLDGRELAVQSCGAMACRTRVIDLADATLHEVAEPSHGDLVGLADGRLVLHEACGGLPCPLITVAVDGGGPVTLDDAAGQAVLAVGSDGRPVVVHEVGADLGALRAVHLDGGGATELPPDPVGRRLVAGPGRSAGAAEIGPGLILLGPGGRLPTEGRPLPILRRLSDGASLDFAEVPR